MADTLQSLTDSHRGCILAESLYLQYLMSKVIIQFCLVLYLFMTNLSTYEDIKTHFGQLCSESRTELRMHLLSSTAYQDQLSSPFLQQDEFEQELTKAFQAIYTSPNRDSAISAKIQQMFGIDGVAVSGLDQTGKRDYVVKCIGQTISKGIQEVSQRKRTDIGQIQHQKQLCWMNTNSKYKYLKPMFQQILLEKVREFDLELGDIVKKSSIRMTKTNLKTTADSIDYSDAKETIDTQKRCHSSMSTKFCRVSLTKKPHFQKDKFQNVSIRDKSKFLKSQWTRTDEDQFLDKKKQFVDTFRKGSNIPIIYQFVKKYTTTTKARDLLLRKWERKEDITEQELRYLCATSVFLNQSINRTDREEIKQKIGCLSKDLLSRLQANIAQKIIQTYKLFVGKVSNIRGKYYLKKSETTKRQLQIRDVIERQSENSKSRYACFFTYKKMFNNICNSNSMKWKLNYKVCRWVYLFIDKLKSKCNIHSNRAKSRVTQRLTTVKSSGSIALRRQHPSARVIKQDYCKKKEYDRSIEVNPEQITRALKDAKKFNQIQFAQKSAYLKTHSSGPLRVAKTSIRVEHSAGKTVYSLNTIPQIIYVQACWRRAVAMRNFKKEIVSFRKERQIQFNSDKSKLRLMYPPMTSINYHVVLRRINKLEMLRIFIRETQKQLIVRKIKKEIPFRYTYFSEEAKSQEQLQTMYNQQTYLKKKFNFEKLMHYCDQNMFNKLINSNMVWRETDLNIVHDGKTALCCSIRNKNHRLTKILLEGRANPNLTDMSKQTPMHLAFKLRDLRAVLMLIDFHADLNAVDYNNNTPLYFANESFLGQLGLEGGKVSLNHTRQEFTIDNNELFKQIRNKAVNTHETFS